MRVGEEPLAIDYMPWADLHQELQIGPVNIWPFRASAENRISNLDLRTELARFFGTFVDHVGRPVDTVAVCSCGDVECRGFTREEAANVRAAIDCLVFASIACGSASAVCADDRQRVPPSADRFELYSPIVAPLENGLVVSTATSRGYWTAGKYFMTRPIYLGGSHWGHFEPVLGALSRVFDSGFPTDQRSRLFRSLEWFRFAHTEATSVSLLQKVVMMVTAYEILLDFPNWGKKRYFIKQVDDQLRLPESRLVQVKDKDGTTFCVCPAAQWAADFYNLRNDITHGDEVPYERLDYKGWVSHLTVADVVFLELVERMLYRHGCIGQHLRERVAELAPLSSDPPEALEAALLPGICGLNLEDVHEALGWIPPLAERCADFEE